MISKSVNWTNLFFLFVLIIIWSQIQPCFNVCVEFAQSFWFFFLYLALVFQVIRWRGVFFFYVFAAGFLLFFMCGIKFFGNVLVKKKIKWCQKDFEPEGKNLCQLTRIYSEPFASCVVFFKRCGAQCFLLLPATFRCCSCIKRFTDILTPDWSFP